ncbi:MAG: HYR domain-containing protein [Flavobacterium sp.]|nr:MAG: HYR domain-containing protein [Flavobacterium sp.]
MKKNSTTFPKNKKRQLILILFLLAGIVFSYGQNGCPQVSKSIIDGANGFSVTGKAPSDDLSAKTRSAGDINGDGIPDLIISAPGADFGGLLDVGEVYIIFGGSGFSFDNFDVSTLDGTNGFVIRGNVADEQLGLSLDTAGDFNNDGISDIVVSSNSDPLGQGLAFVFYGKNTPFQALYNRTDIDNAKGIFITIEAPTDVKNVGYAGDVNHDGISDVIISDNANSGGKHYIVFGTSSAANIGTSSLNGSNGFSITGYASGFLSLNSVCKNAGDFNNDGIDDLVLGYPSMLEVTGSSAGRTIVLFGRNVVFPASILLDNLTSGEGYILTGSGNSTYAGTSVAAAGDFNHDGIADIIIGSPNKTVNGIQKAGEVYIVFGGSGLSGTSALSDITTSTGVIIQGSADSGKFGTFVNGIKDINRDGTADVAISGERGISYNGAVYVVFGGSAVTGIITDKNILNTIGYQIFDSDKNYSNGIFGNDFAGLDDFNQDGTNDFVIGNIRKFGYTNKGTAFVFYGETIDRTDKVLPTIVCPGDQQLFANSTLPDYISLLSDLTDNCNYTNNFDFITVQSPPQGTLFTADTNVTITVTDLSGNVNSCSFLVKLKSPIPAPSCKSFESSVNNIDGSNGFVLYGESGVVKAGYSVNKAGDVNGDGIDDFIVSALGINYSSSGAFQNKNEVAKGAAYVIFGTTSGFPPTLDLRFLNGSNGFIIRNDINPAEYDETGFTVSDAGDLNGDGLADLMLSAPSTKGSGFIYYLGAVYVVFGKSGGYSSQFLLSSLDGTNGFVFRGTVNAEYYGYSLDNAGDFNGDGYSDILIGGIGIVPKAFVIYGKNGGFPAQILSTDINGTNGVQITSSSSTDKIGRSVAGLGDINGDGVSDIVLSSYDGAKKFVVYGRSGFPASLDVMTLDGTNGFSVIHSTKSIQYGRANKVGDLNHDGFNDIAFSRNYILFGSSAIPASVDLNNLNGTNGFTISDTHLSERFGGIGDFNNDGIDDYVFLYNTSYMYVLFGKNTWEPTFDLSNFSPNDGVKISINFSLDPSLDFAGDINKDGFDDIVLGLPAAIFPGNLKINVDTGKAYVIYGRANILDTEKPVITNCPSDMSIAIGSAIPDFKYSITVKDNCDTSPQITQTPPEGTIFTGDPINVVLTATDASSLSETCSFAITLSADKVSPVLFCPANKQLACGSVITDYRSELTVFDETDTDVEVTQTPAPGTPFYDGMDISFVAKDDAGNESTCSFSITASGPDSLPPTFNCPTNLTLNCGDVLPNYAADPIMNVADNCSKTITSEMTPPAGTPFYDGIKVHITYKDESGNEDSCDLIIHTSTPDITSPTINCIGDQGLSCEAVLPDYTTMVTATDNCVGTVTITQSPVAGTAFTPGMTVTLTATDVSNNKTDCTITINVSADNVPPVITCPANQNLACGSTIPDYTNLVVVTDNCDAAPVLTQDPIAGTAFTDGMTITIIATDISNNSSQCDFIINNVPDDIKPVINCISDQELPCGATIPDYTTLVTATDNCDATPVITQSPAVGTPFVNGMTIKLTAKDASDNEEYCSFVINASADNLPPVISCVGDQNISCATIIPDYTALVSATDNCDSSPVITQNPVSGSAFTDGMTITMTAKDASGNEAFCTFKVNASADVTPPQITCIANQSVFFNQTLPDYRNQITATDNCDSNLTIVQNPVPGSALVDGMTVEMSTADNSGNAISCSFTIKVVTDTEGPKITCLQDQSVACSATKVPDYTALISVTDNTDLNPVIIQDPVAGSDFTDGMTINIIARDASTNESNCSFKLNADILLVDAGNDAEIKEGENIQIEAIATKDGTFNWTPSEGVSNIAIANPFFSPIKTTTYTVYFKSEDGCETQDEITISVLPKETDETKYGFSPNNDGINDVWMIDDINQYPNNKVSIYNRWGDLVFQISGYNNTTNVFTGIANKSKNLGANELPEGTYFFEINPNADNHHFTKLKGYLVLKR